MKKVTIGAILIFAFALSATVSKSVHMVELEDHYFDMPLILHGIPSKKLLSEVSLSKPLTEKLIFGYLAYWENKTDHLRYALLTDLLYFSCGLAADGELGDCRDWPEAAPIDEAHRYGVRVHLVITGFDGPAVQTLIENENFKTVFFKNCWDKVNEAGADGINIDFESFADTKPSDLTRFFNDLGEYFHSRNSKMIVSAALPAVDWSNRWNLSAMTGLDYAFLMLYDYHWKAGEPGPVAPLYSKSPWTTNGICVEKSINTYISKHGEAIKGKLITGYPYYGIKWKTTSGSFPGTKIENGAAVVYDKIYSDFNTISTGWDTSSETPYKIWKESSQWYQLWYDDDQSIGLKYAFAKSKDVAGSGMWALNYDKSREDLWKKIAENFVSDKSGSFEKTVKIDSFPFEKTDNTYRYTSDVIDVYDCVQNISDTTEIDESGPEIIFEFETECNGTLKAEITEGSGESNFREDIDIHLLHGADGNSCIFRSDAALQIWLEKGKYFITADSFSSGGVVKGGEFRISVDFICDETENSDLDDTKYNDDDDEIDETTVITDDSSVESGEDSDLIGVSTADDKNEKDDDTEENRTKESKGCSINAL